jgi:uncharacterized membrane protein
MKKKIYFLMMLIVATTMLSVSSCSKDNDEKENENSLVGTTWVLEANGVTGAVLSFHDESNCTMVVIESGSYDGAYSYSPPNIVITLDVHDKSGVYNIFSGTVSGDTMTLSTIEGSGTFVKR